LLKHKILDSTNIKTTIGSATKITPEAQTVNLFNGTAENPHYCHRRKEYKI
jgi:hypothetical protein